MSGLIIRSKRVNGYALTVGGPRVTPLTVNPLLHKIGRKPVDMHNFKSSTAKLIELHFFMKRKMKKMKKMKHVYLYFIPCVIQFFACSYFFTLDVHRRQIQFQSESENFLTCVCMAIMLDHPRQSLYYK